MDIPPFKDLLQLSKDHNQIWPADLVDDLEEEEPQISSLSCLYSTLIASYFNQKESPSVEEPEKKETFLPPLIVAGWNNTKIKGTKNWADFENLLLFYTIGKLAVANTPENQKQKERDLSDLRGVIEEFLPLRGQKRKSAEERIKINTTYLAFGKRVIDSLVRDNSSSKHEIQREIEDAEESNSFNAAKLAKSRSIACRVFQRLKNRYSHS